MIVQPLRAISFDVNGTLIHSPRLGEVYAQVLGRHGIEVEPQVAFEVVKMVWQEFWCSRRPGEDLFASHPGGTRGFWFEFIERVCRHLDSSPPTPFAKSELFQIFAGPEPWEIYPEVLDVLRHLRRLRLRMVVVSNWDDRLPKLLEALGLAEFFETIVFSAGVGVEKPFPAIFGSALDRMELSPAEVIHVGDKLKEDVEGARGVGMHAIHLTRDAESEEWSSLEPMMEWLPAPRIAGTPTVVR